VLKELGVPHDPPSILNIGNLRTVFANPKEVSLTYLFMSFVLRIVLSDRLKLRRNDAKSTNRYIGVCAFCGLVVYQFLERVNVSILILIGQ